jgi:hypothetical protein
MILFFLILTLILLILTIRALYLLRNSSPYLNSINISRRYLIYVIMSRKICILFYVLQSFNVMAILVVFGYYLAIHAQCKFNNKKNPTIIIIWIIALVLLLISIVVWILIVILNYLSRKFNIK